MNDPVGVENLGGSGPRVSGEAPSTLGCENDTVGVENKNYESSLTRWPTFDYS